MAVAFGFSVGDFITGAGLVKDIIGALRDSGGASENYTGLIHELEGLGAALSAIDQCRLDPTTQQFAIAVSASNDCHFCIERFLEKHAKYEVLHKDNHGESKTSSEKDGDDSASKKSSRSWLKGKLSSVSKERSPSYKSREAGYGGDHGGGDDDVEEKGVSEQGFCGSTTVAAPNALAEARLQLRKVRWALCQKDDIDELRHSLATRTTALSLLLSVLQVTQQSKQTKMLGEVRQCLERSEVDNSSLLQHIVELLVSMQIPTSSKEQESFEVRPLRLVGAPVIVSFIERDGLMAEIEEALLPVHEEQNLVVLVGMGGIGKSQLARAVALRYLRDFSAIFWINAKTEETLRSSLAALAEQVPLSNVLNASGHINRSDAGIMAAINAMKQWLSKEANNRWLLIFDNVDSQVSEDINLMGEVEEESASGTRAFDAYPYIPQVSHGTVLITSRLSFLGRAFGAQTIRVDQMSLTEGVELVCKLSQFKPDEPDLDELVRKLGMHPLALNQAANLLAETLMRPSKYLRDYNVRFKRLLQRKPGAREYSNGSIDATLGLSYDQLLARNPSAAALLILFGCFDNSSISFQFFKKFHDSHDVNFFCEDDLPLSPPCKWIPGLPSTWLSDIAANEDRYFDCITSLNELSFIRQNDTVDAISLHPLVHEWALLYCDDADSRYMVAGACNVLSAAVPNNELSIIGISLSLIQPHIKRVHSLLPRDLDGFEGTVAGLLGVAAFFESIGPASIALRLYLAGHDLAIRRRGLHSRIAVRAKLTLASYYNIIQETGAAIRILESLRSDYALILQSPSLSSIESDLLVRLLMAMRLWGAYTGEGQTDKADETLEELRLVEESGRLTRFSPVFTMFYRILATPGDVPADELEEVSLRAIDLIDDPNTWPSQFGAISRDKASIYHLLGSAYNSSPGAAAKQKAIQYLRISLRMIKEDLGPLSSQTTDAAWGIAHLDSPFSTRLIESRRWLKTVKGILKADSELPAPAETENGHKNREEDDGKVRKAQQLAKSRALVRIRWREVLSTSQEMVAKESEEK